MAKKISPKNPAVDTDKKTDDDDTTAETRKTVRVSRRKTAKHMMSHRMAPSFRGH